MRDALTSLPSPVHLLGVGGAGVSSLAEYLAGAGLSVSGCDAKPSHRLERLETSDIKTSIGHDPLHLSKDIRSVVYSAAIPRSHPELVAAREMDIRAIPRSLALARISRERNAICIAGSHGKSTVSAMTAHLLASARHDPGFIIGAVLRETGTGGYYGSGSYVVLETDEFDRTLERVCPAIAVITNVESEHLDVYGTMQRLFAAFLRFAQRAATRNGAVFWTENPGGISTRLLRGSTLRCGFNAGNDCSGIIIKGENKAIHAIISLFNRQFDIKLPLAGTHNLMNAILSSGAAYLAGLSIEEIARSFSDYKGLERRFERLGGNDDMEFYSDYAHHPTEIKAVLETAQALDRPILTVFQPHLFSRTAALYSDFATSLIESDYIVVTAVYPAREKEIPGITGELVTDSLNSLGKTARYAKTYEMLEEILHSTIKSPMTVLFLSAGDLDAFARKFVEKKFE